MLSLSIISLTTVDTYSLAQYDRTRSPTNPNYRRINSRLRILVDCRSILSRDIRCIFPSALVTDDGLTHDIFDSNRDPT
jgi:hypothetical protein